MIIRFFRWLFGRQRKPRCHHEKTWKLIDKTILPTPYEQLMEDDNVSVKIRRRVDYLFEREVILTYECAETGEIKIISTKEDDKKNKH